MGLVKYIGIQNKASTVRTLVRSSKQRIIQGLGGGHAYRADRINIHTFPVHVRREMDKK